MDVPDFKREIPGDHPCWKFIPHHAGGGAGSCRTPVATSADPTTGPQPVIPLRPLTSTLRFFVPQDRKLTGYFPILGTSWGGLVPRRSQSVDRGHRTRSHFSLFLFPILKLALNNRHAAFTTSYMPKCAELLPRDWLTSSRVANFF